MNSWKNFTLLALLFSGSISFAKTTVVGISGVSNQSNDGTTYYAFGGYNGAINGCSSPSAGSTCDSCSGAPAGFLPCNHTSVHPTLSFHVNLHTDNTQLGTATVMIQKAGSGTISIPAQSATSGGDFYFDMPWSTLCSNFTTPCSFGGTSSSETLKIGLGDGSTFLSGEYATVRVSLAYVDGSSFYQKCDPDANASGGTNDGFCFVDVLAGDGKVYATKTNVASTFPASSSLTDVKWNALVFFYEKGPDDPVNDPTTIGTVTLNSQTSTISYDNTSNPPTFDPRITGLDNDSRYCFIMANQDSAGNISKFTDTSTYTNNEISSLLCAHPDEVFGLLDDKKCFIATAAWGSSLDPHVSTLRLFRDQFLKTNSLGKAFVKFYYDHSPDWAQYISYHDHLRAVARVGLWPLVGFANLSLALGFSGAVAILLFALAAGAGGVVLLRRRFRKDL